MSVTQQILTTVKREIEIKIKNAEIVAGAANLPPVDKLALMRQFAVSLSDGELKLICKFMDGCKEWDEAAGEIGMLGDRMITIGQEHRAGKATD